MTKSEAKSVGESTARALRCLEGAEMPWPLMSPEAQQAVLKALQVARDELQRIHDMASAELGGKR